MCENARPRKLHPVLGQEKRKAARRRGGRSRYAESLAVEVGHVAPFDDVAVLKLAQTRRLLGIDPVHGVLPPQAPFDGSSASPPMALTYEPKPELLAFTESPVATRASRTVAPRSNVNGRDPPTRVAHRRARHRDGDGHHVAIGSRRGRFRRLPARSGRHDRLRSALNERLDSEDPRPRNPPPHPARRRKPTRPTRQPMTTRTKSSPALDEEAVV